MSTARVPVWDPDTVAPTALRLVRLPWLALVVRGQIRAFDRSRGRALLCDHDVDPDNCLPEPAYLSWLDLATGNVTALGTLWPEWRENYPWTFRVTAAGEVIAESAEATWLIAADGSKQRIEPA